MSVNFISVKTCADPEERGGGSGPCPTGKSQVAIGFLKNTGTDPLEKQLDPEIC